MSWSTGAGPSDGGEDGTAFPRPVTERVPRTIRSQEPYQLVLSGLVEEDGDCPLSVLTRRLAEAPDTGDLEPPVEASPDSYRQAHLSLVREYLPVLREFRVLTYDEESGHVRLTVPSGRGDGCSTAASE
jgi:hypothetical protein